MEIVESDIGGLETRSEDWALTLGSFDGVHRGHLAICRRVVELVRENGLRGGAAVTFARHPRAVLDPQRPPRLLTTPAEKIPLLAATGLDRLYVLSFDEELRKLDYRSFVRDVLIARLGMRDLVLGHDVHFGHERGGTADAVATLARHDGFRFHQVESVLEGGEPVSSTRIRGLIEAGRLEDACALLGHPYLVRGEVVEGRGLGRRLGFPTANLKWGDPAKLLPPPGVYAAWAREEGRREWAEAVLNLGTAPTVDPHGSMGLEVHLLDGDHRLQGRILQVVFGERIRSERRFPSLEELVARIQQDVAEARPRLAALRGWRRPEAWDRPGEMDRPGGAALDKDGPST